MPIYQGTQWTRSFTLKSKKTGGVMDVSGFEFRMQIRKRVADAGDPLIDLTTANGGIYVLDGAAGKIVMVLDEGQTLSLPTGGYKFDVLRTDMQSGGGPVWMFGGKLKVKQPVTRT